MAIAETRLRPRVDSQEKVTGEAIYTEDLPDLPGTLSGRVLLSPHSHARIISIDSSAALQLAGVVAVLTREQLEGFSPWRAREQYGPGDNSSDQTFIAIDKVRFDGDLVGVIDGEALQPGTAVSQKSKKRRKKEDS